MKSIGMVFGCCLLCLACGIAQLEVFAQDPVPEPIPEGGGPNNGGSCNRIAITGEIVELKADFQNSVEGPPPVVKFQASSKAKVENWKFGQSEFSHHLVVRRYLNYPNDLTMGPPLALPAVNPPSTIDGFSLAKCAEKNTSDLAPTLDLTPGVRYQVQSMVMMVVRHTVITVDPDGNEVETEEISLVILDSDAIDVYRISELT